MPLRTDTSPEAFIAYLNELFELDPFWVERLIEYRPACNGEIARHPSVQVKVARGKYHAGLLGLINGFYGTLEGGTTEGAGPVAMEIDDRTHEVKGFCQFKRKVENK